MSRASTVSAAAISYANAAANKESSSENMEQSTGAGQIGLDGPDGADAKLKDDSREASREGAAEAPQAEEEAEPITPSLAPAPLPTTNAWGKITSEVPNSDGLTLIIDNNKQQQSSYTPSSSSSSSNNKWVPYKGAKIVIVDSSSSSLNSNKRKPKKTKKKSNDKKQTNSPSSHNAKRSSPSTSKANNKKSDETSNTDAQKQPSSDAPSHEKLDSQVEDQLHTDSASSDQSIQSNTTKKTNEINGSKTPAQVQNPKNVNGNRRYRNNNNRQHKNVNNGYHSFQQPDFVNGYAFNPRYQHKNTYAKNHYNNNTTTYGTKYVNGTNNSIMSWISNESRSAAVNAVTYQLDYYFDISNLLKDIYLRKHMNSHGWIDLEFVTQFYRVRALSCGDLTVIRDALDYCQNFEYGFKESSEQDPDSEAAKQNPIKNIKVRALNDPHNWVLPLSSREGCGLDESGPAEVTRNAEPTEKPVETESEN